MTLVAPSIRVGTDLCSVDQVAESIDRFGDRYLERVYTPDELSYCSSSPTQRNERLAARFAAKEATVKVLRTAGSRPEWRSIEIVRDPEGWCDIRLTGSAATLAESAGIVSLAVSMSHENDLASAVVIASVCADGSASEQTTVSDSRCVTASKEMNPHD